ncbi:serine O-acetyltransferase EpsC [Streptacidiphilus sp. N1-12]|uniref:Serine O-acetyltransferase EpsC n=2 Tax=Streptacidiphilus alkalitolerans TaxID=3342712 RepID=A0ABV6WKU5_9ACTN
MRTTPRPTEPRPTTAHRLTDLLREDLRTIRERDPSVRSTTEAVLHPSFTALALHRLSHLVHTHDHRTLARLLATASRLVTQIEIHPGAQLGRRVFIDHGSSVVIGETAVVGDDVTLFHQVTLGSVGWWHDAERPPGSPRHPTVEADVILGCGATVLGPVTVGRAAVIGANALVVKDVPSGARVLSPIAAVQLPAVPGPATLPQLPDLTLPELTVPDLAVPHLAVHSRSIA